MADLLNVSIAEAERLLDEGQVPFTRGKPNLRRVRFQDVMDYRRRRDAERREALDELARLSQELGLVETECEDDPWAEERSVGSEATPRAVVGRHSS
jgi:hypothetical protein